MDIAFISERLLVGFGVDLVIDQLASRLSVMGHDVTVYASKIDDAARTGTYRIEHLPVKPDRFYPRYEWRARRWTGHLDAAGHDVIFIETFPFYSLIPSLRTPTIAVDNGISSTEGLSLPRRAMFAYTTLAQYRRYLPRAAGIVTISEYVRGTLPGSLRDRARVILLGADHYPIASAERGRATRARLGIEEDTVLALYVGRLNPERQPYKGTADLMGLAPRWRERGIRLVMAGRGDEADAARISAAGAIPLLDVPARDLSDLYAAADLFVTASRWEGFDLPLAEAAHAGVPGVALGVGAHKEVVADGETAMLAHSIQGLAHHVETLGADPTRRRAMGMAAASRMADRFTWDRVARAYEEIALSRTRSREVSRVEGSTTDVTALVLNYGADHSVLARCLASVNAQTHPTDAVMIDNGSVRNRDSLDRLAAAYPKVRQIRLKSNLGFAGGINAGIRDVRTRYVLVLNNDTELDPNAVAEMRSVLDADPSLAGAAPKIVFAADPDIIDAIGTVITRNGAAFNRGIGQIDIGQYDVSERTFGACFAAAMLRTELFDPKHVGPLDDRYFMYYEDVDWCFRANILGHGFATAPAARVKHEHSYSTRSLDHSFKHRLIQSNYIRTAIKDFERSNAARIVIRRFGSLGRDAGKGLNTWANLEVLAGALAALPSLLRARSHIQPRRSIADDTLIAFAHGERPFFDAVNYRPEGGVDSVAAMYERRARLSGNLHDSEIAAAARDAAIDPSARPHLKALLRDQPARVRTLIE